MCARTACWVTVHTVVRVRVPNKCHSFKQWPICHLLSASVVFTSWLHKLNSSLQTIPHLHTHPPLIHNTPHTHLYSVMFAPTAGGRRNREQSWLQHNRWRPHNAHTLKATVCVQVTAQTKFACPDMLLPHSSSVAPTISYCALDDMQKFNCIGYWYFKTDKPTKLALHQSYSLGLEKRMCWRK